MPHSEAFRFRIRQSGAAWLWATIDLQGRVRRQGSAPTRAIAAAFVIQAIADDAFTPEVARAA